MNGFGTTAICLRSKATGMYIIDIFNIFTSNMIRNGNIHIFLVVHTLSVIQMFVELVITLLIVVVFFMKIIHCFRTKIFAFLLIFDAHCECTGATILQ